MKMVKSALLFILSLLFLISCEKQLFDFRTKYLGTWEFEVSNGREWYTQARGFFDTTTTSTYLGEIKYGSEHRMIKFVSGGYSAEFPINRDGSIIPENDHGMDYSESGGFEESNIFKYHYFHRWGGTPYKFVSTDISGVKK